MRGRIKGGSGDIESARDGSTACVSTHSPAPRVARALYALSDFVQSTAKADLALCLRTKNLLRTIGNFYGERFRRTSRYLPTHILTVFPPLLHHSCCKQPASNSAGSFLFTCQLEVSFRIM